MRSMIEHIDIMVLLKTQSGKTGSMLRPMQWSVFKKSVTEGDRLLRQSKQIVYRLNNNCTKTAAISIIF